MEPKALLFALLRHAVCAEPLDSSITAACTPENLDAVYVLAKKHDLSHVVAYALEGLTVPDCEALEKLKKAKITAIYRYARLDHAFEGVCHVLNRGKIPFMPLKGSVLRTFYPEPWMRSSCDIDILVKPEDLWNAVLLLEEAGYRRKGKGHHDVSLFASSGVHLELHYALTDGKDPEPIQKLLSSVWEQAKQKADTESHYYMPDGMFYLYHIAHMAGHLLQGGCGIRTVLDVWILNRVAGNPADRETLLRRGGLLAFAKAAEKLAACWFSDIPMDEETACFESFVLKGGIYGTGNNGVEMRKAAGKKLWIPFNRILLPYAELRYAYPVLDQRPWLLPVCQILRWFRLMGVLNDQLKKQRAARKVSQKKEREMQQLLQYLGLRE